MLRIFILGKFIPATSAGLDVCNCLRLSAAKSKLNCQNYYRKQHDNCLSFHGGVLLCVCIPYNV